MNLGSISRRYSACLIRKSASWTLPLPLQIHFSAAGPYTEVYSSNVSSSVGTTRQLAPMTQWLDMRTVWCTRDRVEIVLLSPMEGDSTPSRKENRDHQHPRRRTENGYVRQPISNRLLSPMRITSLRRLTRMTASSMMQPEPIMIGPPRAKMVALG